MEDMRDGTSHTAIFAEPARSGRSDVTSVDNRHNTIMPSSVLALTQSLCDANAGPYKTDRGLIWADGESVVYDHAYQPNARTWDCMASVVSASELPAACIPVVCRSSLAMARCTSSPTDIDLPLSGRDTPPADGGEVVPD